MPLFEAPVGSEEERKSGKIWPGEWIDSTGFLNEFAKGYPYGLHTGADLNLNLPGNWNADANSPTYAIGDGVVTYARRWPNPKVWGKIVVINHGIVDRKPLFSRYAHVETIHVSEGQLVQKGHHLADIGDGDGIFKGGGHHLHFDISITDVLLTEPQNWPAPSRNPDRKLVESHYVNPKTWLQDTHALHSNVFTNNILGEIKPGTPVWYVIAKDGAWVHKAPGMSTGQVRLLTHGTILSLSDKGVVAQDGFHWGLINGGELNNHWLAIRKEDESETYISTNPPV